MNRFLTYCLAIGAVLALVALAVSRIIQERNRMEDWRDVSVWSNASITNTGTTKGRWSFTPGTNVTMEFEVKEAANPLEVDRELRVDWMNDSVYIGTNWVDDEERNALNTNENELWLYMKPVVYTNKVDPLYFRFGFDSVELGAREDGVIVWRKARE